MSGVVDTIVLILFVGLLIVVSAGFNRQMVEQNKQRQKKAEDRMKKTNKEEMKND